MTKTKQITKAEVKAVIKRLIAERPDAINPTEERMCLYRKGRGRNIKRCIIGQLGYEMGLPTPKADAGSVRDLADNRWDGLWAGRFTDAAVEYMARVQGEADGHGKDNPTAWGQISRTVVDS